MKGKQFVLSADRSLMSHYRDNMLYGFIACMPAEKVNPLIYREVLCPTVEFSRTTGHVFAAPLGLPREWEDVHDTIELIKRLDGMATVVAPMLYTDYHKPENTITAKKMTKLQWELYFRCWMLSAKTVSNWIWYGTAHFNPIVRIIASVFTKMGVWYVLRAIRDDAKKEAGLYLN